MFTQAEISTIRRFVDWLKDAGHIGYSDGLTDFTDEGVVVTEFGASMSYGDCELDRDVSTVPLLALTDPGAYARQLETERQARQLAYEARVRANQQQREAEERALFQALQRKYGS